MRHVASAVLVALVMTCGLWAAGPVNYQVLNKVTVGGDGGWDYLLFDPDGNRLFVSRGTHVMVLDAKTGATQADLPDTPGVHGIALAPEFGKGFISNGRSNNITIFDLKTLKATGQADAGTNPDAIIYDPASKRVFAFNGRSSNATAIDAATGKVAGTIALTGKPESGVSDGKGKVFVNIEDKHSITAIDSKALTATATWEIAGCEDPSGLAIDRKNHVLFSGCANKIMAIVDADSGKLITTLPIGAGVDATGFDSKQGLAFSSNGEGNLTVVKEKSPKEFEVAQTVETARGARTMTLDERTGTVYLVTAQFGERPAPTADQPRPRAPVIPGSFTLVIVGQK
jgi:DNA-binding beta-propeller fold protein YncE